MVVFFSAASCKKIIPILVHPKNIFGLSYFVKALGLNFLRKEFTRKQGPKTPILNGFCQAISMKLQVFLLFIFTNGMLAQFHAGKFHRQKTHPSF